MNLAFVLKRLGTDGGTEKYVHDLCGFLAGRGHAITVYCVDLQPGLALDGVTIRRLAPSFRRGIPGIWALIRASSAVDLDAHDVVQGFGRTLKHHVFRAGGGAHAAYLDLAAPSALTPWSPRERVELYVDRRAMEVARRVVCNSDMAADHVVRWYGLRASRIRVVRNGVDLERFRPDPTRRAAAREAWQVPDGGRVALFLGNGFRRKGLGVAGRAFAAVAGPRDRFVVAGHDAHASRWLTPLEALLGERLVVLGPTRAPEDLLPGADATVLPTRYDAAANTTIEALACGVPPVTSTRDGNAALVPDPRWVVADPEDVDGFATAIRRAWEADAGDACRKTAARWPVSRNGEAMEALYQEIVDGR